MSKKAISLDDLAEEPQVATAPEVQPPAEEPVETPTEEPTQTVETPQETPPVETPAEPEAAPAEVEPTQTTGIDLEFFNKKFNKSFESEDQILAEIDKPTKELELADMSKQFDDLNQKYEILLEQTDPRTLFSSDAAMKLEMFKKDNPKKDASIAQKIFATEDLESVSNMELVKMGHKFNNRRYKGSDSNLEAMIADEFGVEPDTPLNEWPQIAQSRLSDKAGEYLNQFDDVRGSVTLPERINIDELKTQRQTAYAEKMAASKEGWDTDAEIVLGETKKLNFPIGIPKEGEEQKFFDWELGELPRHEVDAIKQNYISRGVDVNDDSKAEFRQALRLALIDKSLPLVLQKYGDDLLANQEEAHLEESHNPDPLTDTGRPEENPEEKTKRERTEHATGGLGNSFSTNPLFRYIPKKE